jgi:hypothetical protein
VTAKNSIKIKSFCFGTKVFSGVGVKGIAVGTVIADVAEDGDGITSFSCGAAQEAMNKVINRRKA